MNWEHCTYILTDVGKKGDDTYLENITFFTDLDAKKLRRRKLQD